MSEIFDSKMQIDFFIITYSIGLHNFMDIQTIRSFSAWNSFKFWWELDIWSYVKFFAICNFEYDLCFEQMFVLCKHNSMLYLQQSFYKTESRLKKIIWNKYHVIKLCISLQLKHINEYGMKFIFFSFIGTSFFLSCILPFFYSIPDFFMTLQKESFFY